MCLGAAAGTRAALVATAAANVLGSAVGSQPSTFLPPLAEPSAEGYFGLRAGEGLQSLERVRDVSPEDFEARLRTGRPFIVEDAGRGINLVGASCASFREQFPGAQMRAEYAGGHRETFVSLGSESWLKTDRTVAAPEEHLAGSDGRVSAPYVWHVKDGGHEAPPEVRAAVQRAWQAPYFVRGATNLREANESVEFWFARRRGAVLAHADTYCIPAISLQIRGTKRWRLMPPPPFASLLDRYEAHDGGLYGTGLWRPAYEATIREGEAVIFFPNIFHETFVPEDNPECTVAATFQLQLPVPVGYIRAFLPTHAMSHLFYEGHCKDLWHSYATLRPPSAVKATRNDSTVAAQVAQVLAAADSDGDGRLTETELESHLAREEPPWPRWFLTEDYFYDFRPAAEERAVMSRELLRNRATDTLAYHDVNGDGLVSGAELLASLRQWHAVQLRVRRASKLRRRGVAKAAL